MNIHIQDPKVSLKNFDFIIAPEHDGLTGSNVLNSKGAIHYLRDDELSQNIDYLKPHIKKEKIATLIMGGPNKYYNFDEKSVEQIFLKIYNIFIKKIFN